MMTMSPDDQAQQRDDDEGADPTQQDDLIQKLQGELEQVRAQSLVERADIENQRKRMEREVRNACRFANKQLLGDLLPVFDSLEAALANAPADDPLRDGVVLILRELSRVAENNGLIEVSPKAGDAFDPDRHQAMSVVAGGHGVGPGAVSQTFQKGYVLHEQLLRPALVAVASED